MKTPPRISINIAPADETPIIVRSISPVCAELTVGVDMDPGTVGGGGVVCEGDVEGEVEGEGVSEGRGDGVGHSSTGVSRALQSPVEKGS